MKKFNFLLAGSVFLYLVLSILAVNRIMSMESFQQKYYEVEINRIYSGIAEMDAANLNEISLNDYKYVKNMTYLPATEKNENMVREFYEGSFRYRSVVKPWYENGILTGYLRFDFIEPSLDLNSILLILLFSLTALEIFLLIVLYYVKYRLIKPFNRMCEIPYELAKGHFKEEVKEEKNKYLGKFLWGISQLKDTLEVSRKRELELEKEKKQLLLSLSHDIKTPLNAVKLYGKALEENIYEDENQKKHAAYQIGEKTREIEQYVEQIMSTSRENILDIKVEMGEFYLNDLIKKVLDSYSEKCKLRHLELKVGTCENRLLNGDMDRAREVFENIFENIFKYGDGRKIEISFYEEDYCQLIRIFNTGIPVTDSELNHVFESFFRGSNSSGQKGSGLGLYICREIMRKMDGEIFAEKEQDGMAFVLVIR